MTEKIELFFNIIKNSRDFAFDVETNGLDWKKCYVCGYSVSDGKEAVYIPVRHAMDHSSESNISQVDLFERDLAKAIKEHKGKIIGHNIKFDAHFSENHGIELGNQVVDTMIREALINEHKFSYDLETTAKSYNVPQKKGKELYQHIADMTGCRPTRNEAMANYHRLRGDDPLAIEYAEGDTLSTFGVYKEQEQKIYGEELEVVANLENELSYVLQKMERRGIKVDLEKFEETKAKIDELHLEAYSQIPLSENLEPVNVRSNKDLQEYFELCQIDNWEYTPPSTRFPGGQPSFNKDWLGTSDEGTLILNARKYDHLISSFISPFLNYVYNEHIHTNFNQVYGEFGKGTTSGRLSSNYPNMQQVPKRDEELGRIYRSIFIPSKDYILVEYDHSQAEPRLYAHYSGEPILIEGYSKTPFVDMHQIAANMMHIERKDAKNLNLAILYTMGAPKLAKKLKISHDQAKAIIRGWYRTFGKVGNFTRRASEIAQSRGYVRTILGRRARFPDPRWAYRAANRIIQGSSADILKWKMVEISHWIERNNYNDIVRMILNIHDSILFEVHKDYTYLIPEIAEIFASVQEPPFNLRVPFHADYHQGENWSQASYGV